MIWRGEVTRIKDGRPYVRVERLGGPHEFGPLSILEGPWTPGRRSGVENLHDHPITTPLAAGDRVLVGQIEGRPDDLAILGRLE